MVETTPLGAQELAEAADEDKERVETALGQLADRYREGRSGIVLEHVAGGWAFRASRDAAAACARLFERPVERGLSQAALETLAIVAYTGPVSRPEIARIRGVAADSTVASLVERGLIAEAGREVQHAARAVLRDQRRAEVRRGNRNRQMAAQHGVARVLDHVGSRVPQGPAIAAAERGGIELGRI